MLDMVLASGVIEDAPTAASLLMRVLGFLLEVFGIIAILGVIMVGGLYFFVSDNKKDLFRAKKSFFGIVIGLMAVLGALVVLRQIASFF